MIDLDSRRKRGVWRRPQFSPEAWRVAPVLIRHGRVLHSRPAMFQPSGGEPRDGHVIYAGEVGNPHTGCPIFQLTAHRADGTEAPVQEGDAQNHGRLFARG